MRTVERTEAIRLRRDEGKSVRAIAADLGVARSSVSRWVREIELSGDQLEALRQRNPVYNSQRNGARANAERALSRRRAYQEAGRERARRNAAEYAAGCMLYWAEGAKSRNAVIFTNSDPAMMRFFVDFLGQFFEVRGQAIRMSCNLYADHADGVAAIEDFWLRALELPRASRLRSTVNRYSPSSQRKRRNTLPYGTCRVVVNKTAVVQTIFGSIQQIGGFTRDDWLFIP